LVGSIFHMTHKIVSEMTYNVSMGTLNPTIPYHTSQVSVYCWFCVTEGMIFSSKCTIKHLAVGPWGQNERWSEFCFCFVAQEGLELNKTLYKDAGFTRAFSQWLVLFCSSVLCTWQRSDCYLVEVQRNKTRSMCRWISVDWLVSMLCAVVCEVYNVSIIHSHHVRRSHTRVIRFTHSVSSVAILCRIP